MNNKIKDWSNIDFSPLKIIKFYERRDNHTYWLFECICGEKLIRIPYAILNNKYRTCLKCRSGKQSPYWKGFGEIAGEFITTIKHSAIAKNLEFNITAQYLWELFEKQNGKCIFTGQQLYFSDYKKNKKSKTASLDRIDSSKGYIEGNLQWVHKTVNKLKKNLSDEEFINICIKVAEKKGYHL